VLLLLLLLLLLAAAAAAAAKSEGVTEDPSQFAYGRGRVDGTIERTAKLSAADRNATSFRRSVSNSRQISTWHYYM
jgi:hypothetical protein